MNDAYTILEITKEKNECKAVVSINWDAEIFKGHFPANAIFPGALLISLSTDLVNVINEFDGVSGVQDIKFLKPVITNMINLLVSMVLKNDHIVVEIQESESQVIVFKGKIHLKQ